MNGLINSPWLSHAIDKSFDQMIKKRSVNILGHQTSILMEEEFWSALKMIADKQDISINKLIANIDDAREGYNLSSAVRVYILRKLQEQTAL